MREYQYKLLDDESDEDPLSGLANLFDVAMIFAVALMVALVQKLDMQEFFSKEDYTIVKNPGQAEMEIIQRKDGKVIKYKGGRSSNQSSESGQGQKIGSAYQLEDGQIIYIPDGQ